MEGDYLGKKKQSASNNFTNLIFSWTIDDIINEYLFKPQLENIPLTFDSVEPYFGSFVTPLLEETRAELASSMDILYRAPFAEVLSINDSIGVKGMVYDITVGPWRKRFSEWGKDAYQTLPGDMLLLVDGKLESVSDLQHVGRTWAFSLVSKVIHIDNDNDIGNISGRFKVKVSRHIEFHDGLFVVFLMNITTQKRVWNSLHVNGNLNIVKEVLYSDSVVKEDCNVCSVDCDGLFSQNLCLLDKLNESQTAAIMTSLNKMNESQRAAIMASVNKTECCHKSYVEQIWGPPGTGKTTTVSILLFILLQMDRRTLTCAPTSVAVLQIASRVLSLLNESFKTTIKSGDTFCPVGDVLLFGNKERLKIGDEIEDIYLEHRVEKLTECFGSLTGWKHCMRSMLDLLENSVSLYHIFVENETKSNNVEVDSFVKFLQERFVSFVLPLRRCILTFLTHIPRSFMEEYNFHSMIYLLDNLTSFESLLFEKNFVSEALEHLFTSKLLPNESGDMSHIQSVRVTSISVLRALQISLQGLGLPSVLNKHTITNFCFERASLIFCTTSSSYKLQNLEMQPLNILVIDEAAQLKEAESTIPLQLPGMTHLILIGDEYQLPALVTSNICIESGFGRSLFGRLSSLGHPKHLLNVQYRMHPSISFFPNQSFYQNKILDAENVTCKSYEKQYFSRPMFGSYSFINVVGGREEKYDDGRSQRNMVEVAIVVKIVHNLYKAWSDSKKKLTVGIVSPYVGQVASIEEKLAHKYENLDGFSVKVKSIDGFQGGEEDIIILSTVRANSHGSVGFMSSPQRTNVALTRARHCLWILGNERTLTNSDSIWKEIISDARNRDCLFDAGTDECLKVTIIAAKKELEQLDDLVHGNSVLFKHARWKVLFSDDFRRSFGKLKSNRLKKLVLNCLLKVSSGWRPKNKSVDMYCANSSHIIKQFKVEWLYVICTIDIIKEVNYTQVLKVWDLLPLDEIPKLTHRLENIFSAYTANYSNYCTAKRLERNLEIPKSWPGSQDITRFLLLSNDKDDSEVSANPGDGRSYVENSKVSESLLLMKFYSLSSGVVKHMLSGKELNLPMQVTDDQMDIILYSKSSFIIGRSGTGKTTILTMKLFQNEQNIRAASEGMYEAESSGIKDAEVVDDYKDTKVTVLRQLFVTVSPRLCYAVKQHVSQLKSFSCKDNSSADISLDDSDVTSEFSDIPDTFYDIPDRYYPLVITFRKFLMMMDFTLGNSFFERFLEVKESSHADLISSRSVALQTFIRLREVTFDRFCSLYWPRFNSNLTKKLDPSKVFTEIISHIKGGLQAGESQDGKLSLEGYLLLSKGRASTLTKQKRETVYTLFQIYEKMKTEHGDFDLGDLVNDIHYRLKIGNYEGEQMDFVYIDEVQDLSMRQICLFKYICQNVDEGFIFAGDTAQTITKGIDFRFQDIRSLFYKEFLTTKRTENIEKGRVSEIFQLKQNFRTHAGVLDLAQSVIDILYSYFVNSVDILEPETSLISGEAPVLLKSRNEENVVMTIFGGSINGGEIVGFGAEQVILVRDDCEKTDLCGYVGKHALVLTILECKGLEFQDVLLYNFFGTSPLKDQWRVIYGYMKEHDWLDEKLPQSFPTFNESKHSVLCSELKQLYVAITRTRQRLWICENNEELSKPMFDFWKTRGLVQIRTLDDSAAHAMQVASSPQEWLERGKKLFYEHNFVMATMCFEKAGEKMWEKLAKASGLRASADQMRGSNHESFVVYLREAAEIFESIGKLEAAASCYCDLEEYERAGRVYLRIRGKINAAAECFTLQGCYSEAAEAYAKEDQFSNCLSVCKKGNLFDKGLQYIEYWKEHNVQNKEIEQIMQEFLESCALDYHKLKDHKSMMKFVRAFCAMELKSKFLRSLGLLDELLLLEEESGHFLDGAELVSSSRDVLKEADLLGKAEHFKAATDLLIWYVFSSSLWGNGNKGWPIKKFPQKEEVCEKAMSLSQMESDIFFDFVCCELKILCDESSSLPELNKDLHASQKNKSLRGEILSIRKILDSHFHLNISKYDWEDDLPADINKHCEDNISENRVSVRTLAFYWNMWKDKVEDIISSLSSFQNDEPNGHVDFSLNHFGVRKHCVKDNIVYMLVNKDANWIKNAGQKGLRRYGKHLTIDIKELVFAMRSYWQSELLSVGIEVLEILEALNKSKSNALHKSMTKGSLFHQSTSLIHIFEVSKFLLDCQYLHLSNSYTKKLQKFLRISKNYFDLVFPLDWRRSMSENLISVRKTPLSVKLLDDIVLQSFDIQGDLTYWAIGRVMMISLTGRKPFEINFSSVNRVLQWHPAWKSFIVKFCFAGLKDAYVAPEFQYVLENTFRVNWTRSGYISLQSFVYLLDSLLFYASCSSPTIFTSKSSFLQWLTQFRTSDTPSTNLSVSTRTIPDDVVRFIVRTIRHILNNKKDTSSWIKRSKMCPNCYQPLLALKLVMILALICLQVSDHSQVLFDLLLGSKSIAYLLPTEFLVHLLQRRNGRYLNLSPDIVAEAFLSIEDPLLIVSSENSSPKIDAPCSIFVDLRRSKQEIMSVLFPTKGINNVERKGEQPLQINWKDLEELFELVSGKKIERLCSTATIKQELDTHIYLLSSALKDINFCAGRDTTLVRRVLSELKTLSSEFNKSVEKKNQSGLMENVPGLAKILLSIRSTTQAFLTPFLTSKRSNVGKMVVSEGSSSSSTIETGETYDDGHTRDDRNSNIHSKKKRGKKKRLMDC